MKNAAFFGALFVHKLVIHGSFLPRHLLSGELQFQNQRIFDLRLLLIGGRRRCKSYGGGGGGGGGGNGGRGED